MSIRGKYPNNYKSIRSVTVFQDLDPDSPDPSGGNEWSVSFSNAGLDFKPNYIRIVQYTLQTNDINTNNRSLIIGCDKVIGYDHVEDPSGFSSIFSIAANNKSSSVLILNLIHEIDFGDDDTYTATFKQYSRVGNQFFPAPPLTDGALSFTIEFLYIPYTGPPELL